MTNFFTKSLLLLLFFIPVIAWSQNTLIYNADFEAPDTSDIHLNTGDVGTNAGPNQWIIDTNYIGQPIFPNTISEDSTYSGQITHANGNYLHIHDVNVSSVSNANFDPNAASDRFTRLGSFCTLGNSSVHFAFYYLCVGNSNSFGELWYKADSGAWTQVGQTRYDSTYKWKYEDITDPAFENHQNLLFGFRWRNGAGTDTTTSFAIDDIKLEGTYDPVKYPVTIHISQISPDTTCVNSTIDVQLLFSASLCGSGNYLLELSEPGGDFTNPIWSGDYTLNNEYNYADVEIPISSNATPDPCYRVRVTRTDVTPPIYSDTSICIDITHCPNTIFVNQPVMLSNPLDTICVYSAIDIPFNSTGVFTNNRYIAQLSDSNGKFTNAINVIGNLYSSLTYDFLPGTVSGKIVPIYQPIPPGCYYKIRIISTNPPDTSGNVFGPFCIHDCNIQTNSTNDISLCLPPGINTCIPVQINHYNDSNLTYSHSNKFKLEVHHSLDYSIVNTGKLGSIITSNKDTCMQLSIPSLAFYDSLGLAPGMYYIRVVADSSNEPWNNFGTLIRLTVGAPYPSPLNILIYDPNKGTVVSAPADTAVCVNSVMDFELSPDNTPNSEYEWSLGNNNNFASGDFISILFNGLNSQRLSVIETNYGCVGPGSDTLNIQVLGVPPVTIAGPKKLCPGDTGFYSVPLQNYTYYSWSSPTGTIVDTANNTVHIIFTQTGNQAVVIHAVGLCGTASDTLTVAVQNLSPPPITQSGNNIYTVSGYTYQWYFGTDSNAMHPINASNNFTIPIDSSGYYKVEITAASGCSAISAAQYFVPVGLAPLISNEDISIYPNPNNGKFTVDVKSVYLKKLQVKVFNAVGIIVYEGEVMTDAKYEIDLSNNAAGIYFLQLNDGSKLYIQKLGIE